MQRRKNRRFFSKTAQITVKLKINGGTSLELHLTANIIMEERKIFHTQDLPIKLCTLRPITDHC